MQRLEHIRAREPLICLSGLMENANLVAASLLSNEELASSDMCLSRSPSTIAQRARNATILHATEKRARCSRQQNKSGTRSPS